MFNFCKKKMKKNHTTLGTIFRTITQAALTVEDLTREYLIRRITKLMDYKDDELHPKTLKINRGDFTREFDWLSLTTTGSVIKPKKITAEMKINLDDIQTDDLVMGEEYCSEHPVGTSTCRVGGCDEDNLCRITVEFESVDIPDNFRDLVTFASKREDKGRE